MPNDTATLAALTLPDRGKIETDYRDALAALSSALTTAHTMGQLAPGSFHLASDTDREIAGVLLTSIVKPGVKFAKSKVSGVVKATHDAHTAAKSLEHELVDPWLGLEKSLKRAMADYDTEQRIIVERAQKRIVEEVNKEMQESAARDAAALAEAGNIDGAMAVLDAPAPVLNLPPATHRPIKVPGVTSRAVFRYRIIAPDKIAREFMMPDERAIRDCVEQWGESAAAMVGAGSIEVYQDTIIGGRTV